MASFGMRLFSSFYGLVWKGARPFLRGHRRLAQGFTQRLVPESWAPPHAVDCWVQAASGGEAYLAWQLIRELAVQVPPNASFPRDVTGEGAPSLHLLVTSCTRQGLDVLESAGQWAREHAPHLAVHVRYFPLDEPASMCRALEYAQPKVVALLETELWPGLMLACAEKNIPMLVLNARMREKSLKAYQYLGFIWKRAAPTRVLAIADDDAKRFAALFGEERVARMPNMKFDAIDASAALVPEIPFLGAMSPRTPLVLLASVRREEEEAICAALQDLMEELPQAALVLVPRHMERAAFWAERLTMLTAEYGWSVALRSAYVQGDAVASNTVVLWDAFGELQALYARSNAVFVGGSLAPLGGQNFLEPVAAGLIPIVGPSWSNFLWVGQEFFDTGLGVQIPDAGSLAPALIRQLAFGGYRDAVRARFAEYVAPRRGGVRQATSCLLSMIAGE